jgi:hypothetical protein
MDISYCVGDNVGEVLFIAPEIQMRPVGERTHPIQKRCPRKEE